MPGEDDISNGDTVISSMGIEHLLSNVISLYADTGFYWNSFSSAADDELDAKLFNWQLAGGFFVHWN